MASFKLSKRSLNNLEGVHIDLQDVVHHAILITEVDFGVIEGIRSIERQREMVAKGASRTMKSRHLTGHAVDLMAFIGSRGSWEWPLYESIYEAMKYAADELGVRIQWGGKWKMRDGPHYQLTWKHYPARENYDLAA